jgi:ribosomal protein L11 methyltransferase
LGKRWPALDIHVPACDPQLHDLVVAELDDFQLFAIEERDALHGGSQLLRVFFVDADGRNAAALALGRAFRSAVFVQPVDVDDEDWAARSQAHLEPVTIGRLVVSPHPPSSGQHSGPPPRISLVIPPSMGFGTGHHATTRLMLEALQTLDLADRDVWDVGCGSAVLAIAAVKLGARRAEAIDVDPDALSAAFENVRLNEVTGLVNLRREDLSRLHGAASIVMANLTGALLERYAANLVAMVARGGQLVVSGFMQSEPTVLPSLATRLTHERTLQAEEWICAIFRRE